MCVVLKWLYKYLFSSFIVSLLIVYENNMTFAFWHMWDLLIYYDHCGDFDWLSDDASSPFKNSKNSVSFDYYVMRLTGVYIGDGRD